MKVILGGSEDGVPQIKISPLSTVQSSNVFKLLWFVKVRQLIVDHILAAHQNDHRIIFKVCFNT